MNPKHTAKVPPYNTGKVLIGVAYQPRPQYELSHTEERLQKALIGGLHAREERAERLFLRCLAVVGLFGLIIIIATR